MDCKDRTNLGEQTDAEAVTRIVTVTGLDLADIGCGPALASRDLVQLGARVIGIEPDRVQAEKNRHAEPMAGLTFREGGAEKLALTDHSIDGVLFFRSLHHVPIAQMDAALEEAARVLKPDCGFLCVVEPGMTGSHFAVMRPFHDETLVRNEARAALARISGRLFRHEANYRYVQYPRHASFEAMVARVTGQTFNNIARDTVETDEVRALFEAGRSDQDDYVFEQPMLLDFYRSHA
ncbi:MAG: class I SAM-dependent methyltransferase [Novosphingobium sp.]